MTLTVPSAGSVPGRAARITVAAPQTAQVVSQFGDAMAQVGQRWHAEEIQREGTKAALAITSELGQARQEIEQIGDPTQIGPAWDARVAEIRARHITPQMDRDLGQFIDNTITDLSGRHSLALGNRMIGLRQSQSQADWLTTRQTVSAQAATADQDTAAALLEVGIGAIDQRVARGDITPEQAAQEKIDLTQEVWGNRANAAIQADPATFLAEVEAGQWNALGDKLASAKAAAEKVQAELTVKAQKETEAAATAQNKAIGDRLSEMTTIFSAGATAVDESFLNDPIVQAHPDYPKAAAAKALRDEIPGIRLMTPAQLDAAIKAEEAKPVGAPFQMDRVKLLREWRDQAAAKVATDAVAYGVDAGLPVPAFDPASLTSDPAAFRKGLSDRLAYDAYAREKGYATGQAIFSQADLAALKPMLDPKGDPETRFALAQAFILQPGAAGARQAEAAAKAAGADPVFMRALRVMTGSGDMAVAQDMLRGQTKIEAKTVALPPPKAMQTVFAEITGGALDGNAALKAEVMASASAIYAETSGGIDPASTGANWAEDSDAVALYQQAVQRAMGAAADKNGALSIGGVQEVNGAMVALPPGVGRDQVAQALDNISLQLDGGAFTTGILDGMGQPTGSGWVSDRVPEGDPARFRAFAKASIDGRLPDLGTNAADLLTNLQFLPVITADGRQTGIYELGYVRNGRIVKVPVADDPRGTTYRFRLTDLIRGAAQ